GFERRHAHRQKVLAKLEAIDPDALPPDERLNYRLFRRQYEIDVEEYPFQWHLIPLNQREGIQDAGSLADVLQFTAAKDYEDWLTRMRAFPEYMDQTIELMRSGLERRMLLPKVIMARLPGQIRRQIVDDPERSLFFKPFRNFPADIGKSEQGRLTA